MAEEPVNEIERLAETVEKYSVFYKKDERAVYHHTRDGFSIYVIRGNHPPVFGTTYRGRKADWKEYFDEMENRGAIGNLSQAAQNMADCYWVYSKTRKRIVKFLVCCEFQTGGMMPVPGRINDPEDVKWTKERIIDLWELAFGSRDCPPVEIISSVKHLPYSMSEQAEASLSETDYQQALALLHSRDSGKKVKAVEMLLEINSEESRRMLFTILYRESDAAAIEGAVAAVKTLALHENFFLELQDIHRNYASNTDHYDEPEERFRWRMIMEELIGQMDVLEVRNLVKRNIDEIEDDFLTAHPVLITAGLRDLDKISRETQEKLVCFYNPEMLLKPFGDELPGNVSAWYIHAVTAVDWKPALTKRRITQLLLNLMTAYGNMNSNVFNVHMHLVSKKDDLIMMMDEVGRMKRFTPKAMDAIDYFIFLFLDGRMLRDETVECMSKWPVKAGLKKIIKYNQGLLTEEEKKKFTKFGVGK